MLAVLVALWALVVASVLVALVECGAVLRVLLALRLVLLVRLALVLLRRLPCPTVRRRFYLALLLVRPLWVAQVVGAACCPHWAVRVSSLRKTQHWQN